MTRPLLLCNLGHWRISRVRRRNGPAFRLAAFWCAGFALEVMNQLVELKIKGRRRTAMYLEAEVV